MQIKMSTRPESHVPAHLVAASEWVRRQLDAAINEEVRQGIFRYTLQDLAALEHLTRFWQAARRNAAADAYALTQGRQSWWYNVIVMRTALHKLNQIAQVRPDHRDALNRASRYYRLHYRLGSCHRRPCDSWHTILVELSCLNVTWYMKG